MELKDLIIQIRKHMRCSQAELAAQLGVSQKAVSAYEKGEFEPNKGVYNHIKRIATELGLIENKSTENILNISSIKPKNEHELLILTVGKLEGVQQSFSELVNKISGVLKNCEDTLITYNPSLGVFNNERKDGVRKIRDKISDDAPH